jgi:hypothetical protein
VGLLLLDLLHLMGACAALNADELMIETSNLIVDVDDAA